MKLSSGPAQCYAAFMGMLIVGQGTDNYVSRLIREGQEIIALWMSR